MKKLLATLITALICVPAYAGTLSLHTDMSSDATIAAFNDNFKQISDWANGDVEGSGIQGSTVNVKADSIGIDDFADEANPATRDNELLALTIANNGYVSSGLIPATSANLVSDISAGVAYINGVRVSKAATSNTYTASKDTYVDLSITGNYTFSEVANGAAAPSYAANSIRLSKVVTDGTKIASATDLANRRIPGLIIPANYRDWMVVSAESATTLSVYPGSVEVNSSLLTKSTKTTLTVTGVDGDWALGTDQSDPLEFGYVGIDAEENIKLLTSRPSHSNYAVSVTDGLLRYVTENSTVYRVLGWFFLNGSEQLTTSFSTDSTSVSNINEYGLENRIYRYGTTDVAAGATFAVMPGMDVSIDSSGGIVNALFTGPIDSESGFGRIIFNVDGKYKNSEYVSDNPGGTGFVTPSLSFSEKLSAGTHTVRVYWRYDQTTFLQSGASRGARLLSVWED